jgi:hypothetical protein
MNRFIPRARSCSMLLLTTAEQPIRHDSERWRRTIKTSGFVIMMY